MNISNKYYRNFLATFVAGCIVLSLGLTSTLAFNGRDLVLLNIVLPVLKAGWRAHKNKKPLGPAVLQATLGGLIMQKAFEQALDSEHQGAWQTWRTKFLLNTGASLAESAGDKFQFRMDIGPLWLIADRDSIRFRPGIHGVIAPILNLSDGATFDWNRSWKFGTLAFKRGQNIDGTIGGNGALAYSNANNFITNFNGQHAGHEIVHTYQYRRNAFLSPKIGDFSKEFRDRLGSAWIDDTGWLTDWALEYNWARMTGRSTDFDIPLEQEAYYLEGKYKK